MPQAAPAQRVFVEHGPGSAAAGGIDGGFGAIEEGIGAVDDDDFFAGDVSSIMIKPDQILNDQNIANE